MRKRSFFKYSNYDNPLVEFVCPYNYDYSKVVRERERGERDTYLYRLYSLGFFLNLNVNTII